VTINETKQTPPHTLVLFCQHSHHAPDTAVRKSR